MRSTELLLVEKRYNTTIYNVLFFFQKCDFPHNNSELGLRSLFGKILFELSEVLNCITRVYDMNHLMFSTQNSISIYMLYQLFLVDTKPTPI
jgi:hypothetical protein